MKRDGAQPVTEDYGSYSIYYNSYTSYPAAVEAEAAKMDADMAKRHMLGMSKEMMDTLSSGEKREVPGEIGAAGDSWYKSYE